jgi:CBS domain-containing protein
MTRVPTTTDVGATITEAAALMDQHGVGVLVVLDASRPVGIVTDRDLVVRGLARRVPPDGRVDSVMTTGVVTLAADDDVRKVRSVLREHGFRRVPVVDGDRVVGMVSTDDLLVGLVYELADITRPITGQALFAHAEPGLPVQSA